jgi:hypothetical protein
MEARQQYPNYDYSTLEVAQQNHGEHGQAPPQQQPDHSQQGYAQQFEGHNLPQVVEPTYPEVVPKPEEAAVTGTKGDFAGYQDHQHVQHPVPAPAERRIWGLKRKTFFILLAVILLVVIAAAVGGGVGGTVGKNGEKKSDPATGDGSGSGGGGSSGNTTSQSPVLANSGLNAIHWTDSSNVQYNAVFWQAKTHDLMMSLWDSDNKTWELVNITDKMAATSIDVTPKPGTPLAAAARGYPWTSSKLKNVAGAFGIALFYLSPQNTILEIYSVDPRGAAWGLGDLTTSSTNSLKTAPNSQLGAWWGLCEANCSGTIALLYEDDGNALRVANSTDWGTFTLGDLSDGASLAITACSGNFGRDGPAGNSVRLYYEDSNKLSELKYTPGQPWYYGSFLSSLSPPPPSTPVTPS